MKKPLKYFFLFLIIIICLFSYNYFKDNSEKAADLLLDEEYLDNLYSSEKELFEDYLVEDSNFTYPEEILPLDLTITDFDLLDLEKYSVVHTKEKQEQISSNISGLLSLPDSSSVPKREYVLNKNLDDYVYWDYFTDNSTNTKQACSNCWAHAMKLTYEGYIYEKTGKKIPLSEQYLTSYLTNKGCSGAVTNNLFSSGVLLPVTSSFNYNNKNITSDQISIILNLSLAEKRSNITIFNAEKKKYIFNWFYEHSKLIHEYPFGIPTSKSYPDFRYDACEILELPSETTIAKSGMDLLPVINKYNIPREHLNKEFCRDASDAPKEYYDLKNHRVSDANKYFVKGGSFKIYSDCRNETKKEETVSKIKKALEVSPLLINFSGAANSFSYYGSGVWEPIGKETDDVYIDPKGAKWVALNDNYQLDGYSWKLSEKWVNHFRSKKIKHIRSDFDKNGKRYYGEVGHRVVLFGWGVDKASGKEYWLLRNTWGKDNGESGNWRVWIGDQNYTIECTLKGLGLYGDVVVLNNSVVTEAGDLYFSISELLKNYIDSQNKVIKPFYFAGPDQDIEDNNISGFSNSLLLDTLESEVYSSYCDKNIDTNIFFGNCNSKYFSNGKTGKEYFYKEGFNKLLFSWDEKEINYNSCDYGLYYCDQDQFRIAQSKKLDSNSFVSLGEIDFVLDSDNKIKKIEEGFRLLNSLFNYSNLSLSYNLEDFKITDLKSIFDQIPPQLTKYFILTASFDDDFSKELIKKYTKNYHIYLKDNKEYYQFRLSDFLENQDQILLDINFENKENYSLFLDSLLNVEGYFADPLNYSIFIPKLYGSLLKGSNSDLIFTNTGFLEDSWSLSLSEDSSITSITEFGVYEFEILLKDKDNKEAIYSVSKILDLDYNNSLLVQPINARSNNYVNVPFSKNQTINFLNQENTNIINDFTNYSKIKTGQILSFSKQNNFFGLENITFIDSLPLFFYFNSDVNYSVNYFNSFEKPTFLFKDNKQKLNFYILKNYKNAENQLELILDNSVDDVYLEQTNLALNNNRLVIPSDISTFYLGESFTSISEIINGIKTGEVCYSQDSQNHLFWHNPDYREYSEFYFLNSFVNDLNFDSVNNYNNLFNKINLSLNIKDSKINSNLYYLTDSVVDIDIPKEYAFGKIIITDLFDENLIYSNIDALLGSTDTNNLTDVYLDSDLVTANINGLKSFTVYSNKPFVIIFLNNRTDHKIADLSVINFWFGSVTDTEKLSFNIFTINKKIVCDLFNCDSYNLDNYFVFDIDKYLKRKSDQKLKELEYLKENKLCTIQ